MRGLHTRLAIMRPIRAATVFAAVVIVLALPGSALAAKPVEQFRDHFTETFENNLCGIDGTSTIVVQNTFTLYSDDSFKSAGSFRETFTALNGKSVKISSAGTTSGPAPVIDEEAGTITFINRSRACRRRSRPSTGAFCSATPGSSRSPTRSTSRPASSSVARSPSRVRIRKQRVTLRPSARSSSPH